MPNRTVSVKKRDEGTWAKAAEMAAEAGMSLSEAVTAGLRMWIAYRLKYYPAAPERPVPVLSE